MKAGCHLTPEGRRRKTGNAAWAWGEGNFLNEKDWERLLSNWHLLSWAFQEERGKHGLLQERDTFWCDTT